MAMDDFSSAAELKSSAADPSLDEDLFDFPPMEEASADVEAVAEAPAAASAAPDPAPAATPAAAASASSFSGMDPQLDVDIFDFPPLEDDAAEVPTIAGGDIEASIDQASQTVNDMLEDDLGEMIQDHQDEQERQRAEEAARAAAELERSASAPIAAAPAPAVAAPAAAPVQQLIPVAGTSPRAQWVLIGAVIVFMCGVLAIAWQVTKNFTSSLDNVRADVEQGTRELQVQNAEQMERIDQLQQELLAQQLLANQNAASNGGSTPSMRTPSELTMLAAQSSIDLGDFAAARQMLFRDLATADDLPAQERDQVIQRMEFMIATSYKLEAQGLEEKAR